MKLLPILLATFALAGCATSAIHSSAATPVPPEQIYRTERLPAEGNARVVFVRDTGMLGAAVFVHLYIDGDRAASLDPGQKVEFIVAPGEHTFGVKGTDPFGVRAMTGVDLNARAGQSYLYRIQLSQETGATLRRLLKEEAE